MNLLLLFEEDRQDAERFVLRGPRAQHMNEVLGVATGDTVKVGLLDRYPGVAEVLSVSADEITISCTWSAEAPVRPPLELHLAMPRPKTLKKVLWEASAWGVSGLQIMQSKRVEKAFFGATLLKAEQHRPVIHDGMMQGRHVMEPKLRVERSWRRWLEGLPPLSEGRRIVAHPEAEADIAQLTIDPEEKLFLAIGPEGGFVDDEVQRMSAEGFEAVHLGASILRVETAVVSALAQVDLLRRQSS